MKNIVSEPKAHGRESYASTLFFCHIRYGALFDLSFKELKAAF